MSSSPYQPLDENQLRVVIKEEQITVAPGNEVTIQIAVINQSLTEDTVAIAVKGVPAEWTTISPSVVRLAPTEIKQVTLTILPPPVPESRMGEYFLEIDAISRTGSNHSAIARTVLTVAAYQSRGRIGVMLGSV